MAGDSSSRESGRKINNMLGRGVIKRYNSGNKTAQSQVSLYADETNSDIEHPQEFGFASTPLEGAETVVAFFGGNRDSGTVLKVFDKRHHPKDLAPGEVKIYSSNGSVVHVKADGSIAISASASMTITSPEVTIDGNLSVTGDITDQSAGAGLSMQQMRTIYNGHHHAGSPVPDTLMT